MIGQNCPPLISCQV